jgi:hypothetical protein
MTLTLPEIIQIAKDVFEGRVSEWEMNRFFACLPNLVDVDEIEAEAAFRFYDIETFDLSLLDLFRSRLDEAAQNKTSKSI